MVETQKTIQEVLTICPSCTKVIEQVCLLENFENLKTKVSCSCCKTYFFVVLDKVEPKGLVFGKHLGLTKG